MIKKFLKQINESKLKVIIGLVVAVATASASLTVYFTKNINEIARQKLEHTFEEKKLEMIKECNMAVIPLKNRCSMLENQLELLKSYVEFMKMDKTKPNYDKSVKIRDNFFRSAK